MAVVSFCFSMTVGVLWEFFECAMDQFFFLDMQKDTVIPAISSVLLDPAGGNHPQLINGIRDVIIVYGDGTQQALGVGGYLDIGLLDTMEDLFVNFIGATVFSLVGYCYIKRRGQGKFAVALSLAFWRTQTAIPLKKKNRKKRSPGSRRETF